MPDAETITKWVAGIIGGVIMALQGVELKETNDLSQAAGDEIELIKRVDKEITTAIQKQAEMIEILKKQK
jgi:hypothetical protein